MSRPNYAIGIDIERSGARKCDETIAIGATVVDEDLNIVDSISLLGYFPNKTQFEKRCWDEFWSKHQDILSYLVYTGELTKEQNQKRMINELMEFRKKWDIASRNGECNIVLVSDNKVYDGGFINEMIFEHTDSLPIPYDTLGKYRKFWETHSMQRGLLMAIDPAGKQDWGLSERIEKLFDIPPSKIPHDHTPANDAYNIAREYQILKGIESGKYKKRIKFWRIFILSISLSIICMIIYQSFVSLAIYKQRLKRNPPI